MALSQVERAPLGGAELFAGAISMVAANFGCERAISLPGCFTLSPGEELIPGGPSRREGKGAGRGDGEEAFRRRDPVLRGPRAQPTGMTTVTWEGLPWGIRI